MLFGVTRATRCGLLGVRDLGALVGLVFSVSSEGCGRCLSYVGRRYRQRHSPFHTVSPYQKAAQAYCGFRQLSFHELLHWQTADEVPHRLGQHAIRKHVNPFSHWWTRVQQHRRCLADRHNLVSGERSPSGERSTTSVPSLTRLRR